MQRKLAGFSSDAGRAPLIPGQGDRLAPALQSFFGSRLGHDFRDVRIHLGPTAAAAARSVSARAFTSGRDIVFDQGEYAPQSTEGMKLLAHELVHVVQQKRAGPTVAHKGLSSPDDAAEREADSAAESVMSGRCAAPREAPVGSVARKMKNKAILEPLRQNAKACLVHLHGEEKTAKAVAEELYSRRCVNYVHLDTTDRRVQFEISVSAAVKSGGKTITTLVPYTCNADPNRIFSGKGREANAACKTGDGKPHPEVKPNDITSEASAELEKFVNAEWGKGISECRGGKGTKDLAGPLPVLALHNNEGDTAILDKYKDQWAPESDPRLKGGPNPDYSAEPGNKNDVFFVADPPPAPGASATAPDFDAVKGTYNVGLQAQPVPLAGEDGSLSVALQDQRFINVEKEGRDHGGLVRVGSGFKGHDKVYVKNYAMAVTALDILGVPEGACPGPAASTGSQGTPTSTAPTSTKDATVSKGTSSAGDKETEPFPLQQVTDASVPTGCLHFDASTIAARKSYWSEQIARLPIRETVNWIVGAWDPDAGVALMPKLVSTAANEASLQRDCMIQAMQTAVPALGGKTPKGNLVASASRSFADQKGIWDRKWNFTGEPFDRVSKAAVVKSKGLLTEGEKWNPKNKIHKMMWGVTKPMPKPADPAKKTDPDSEKFLNAKAIALTNPEREQEILMASSAPGISRHHAGTEFDLGEKGVAGDLDPKLWQPGEKYFDAGRYLLHNAATWGFMRPFETKGGYGKGYMAEPWHWSYWPVAQALLEFARSHRREMEEVLHAQWKGSGSSSLPQFRFVWSAWVKFLENVDERPRF